MKNILAILCLTVVLTAAKGSAGIPDDIIINPPPLGTLRVEGTPGVNQVGGFSLRKCSPDSKSPNGVKLGSCKLLKGSMSNGLFPLNSSVSLFEGIYWLSYERNSHQVYVSANSLQPTVVKLSKISIPAVPGGVSFSVFTDLSHPAQQNTFLDRFWGRDLDIYGWACEQLNKVVCDAIKQNSPGALRGTIIDFSPFGELFLVDYAEVPAPELWSPRPRNEGRQFMSSRPVPTGSWISVLPGVYGIRFQKGNSLDETSTQYGIVVN